ncbi:hypothetical protein [Rheinheimera texasensis]|uniref:hypothetical protein n=1 Tax=Rheinheimera texasensis TaxID=306205 RepID=UPI0004E0C335|nr:hypothetical protein [Rheinheimera texasensis]
MDCILNLFKRRQRKALKTTLAGISSAVSELKTELFAIAEKPVQEWPRVKAMRADLFSAISKPTAELSAVVEQPTVQPWPSVNTQQEDLFSAVSEPKTELFAVTEPVVHECPPVR